MLIMRTNNGHCIDAFGRTAVPGLWESDPRKGRFHPIGLRRRRAQVLELVGRWDEEEAELRENLMCSADIGDPALMARGEYEMAGVLYLKGENSQAQLHYDKAREGYAGLGDARGVCLAMGGLGCLHRELGDLGKAMDCFREQLRLAEREGDVSAMAQAHGNLGILHCLQGQFDEALDCFGRKLELAQRSGDVEGIGAAVGNMGNAHKMKGDDEKALECYQRQLDTARLLGDRRSIAVAVGNSGVIHNDRGDYNEAIKCFSVFLENAREMGDRRGIGIAAANLGIACKRTGDHASAEGYYDLAIATGRELNARQYLCGYLSDKADLCLRMGRQDEAECLINEALALAGEVGEETEVFKCRLLAARIKAGRDTECSVSEMKRLLGESAEDWQRAEISDELYGLTGETGYRDGALARYRAASQGRPSAEYRQRIAELESDKAGGESAVGKGSHGM